MTDRLALQSSFFADALAENPALMAVRADAMIIEKAAGLQVVPCRNLDVEQYARLGRCTLDPEESPRPGFKRYWGGEDYDRLFSDFDQVVWRISWNSHTLHVVHLEWETGCGGDSRDWVVAESTELAESFILDVERKTHAPGEAILVFSGGRWMRSEPLYRATQTASFDDLVLADNLKAAIRSDFKQFLESEARYQRLGISWRRGALLIGPPGNGKTHCVRALVKELAIASLYVQSLSHQFYTPEQMWRQIFDRARGLRPCVLVLEDLDSLVTAENRSFFLNQLDGFEQNHGLIVLATTNYPERIDAAIIDRPSRFDRKYHFNLPTQSERTDYLAHWQAQLSDEVGWRREDVESSGIATEGFSFAYLKELIVSAVMRWMQDSDASFAEVLQAQADILKRQMKTDSAEPARQNGRHPRSRQHLDSP